MRDSPDCPLGVLFVLLVMEDGEDGLEVKAADDDDADDRMSVAFSGDLSINRSFIISAPHHFAPSLLRRSIACSLSKKEKLPRT